VLLVTACLRKERDCPTVYTLKTLYRRLYVLLERHASARGTESLGEHLHFRFLLHAAMSTAKSIAEDSAYVGRAIKISVVITIVVFAVGYFVVPTPVPRLETEAQRLIYTLRLQAPALVLLMAMIMRVARTRRTTSAINPLDAEAQQQVEVGNNVIRNTVEQFLINAGLQLVLSTYLTPDTMHVIPILSGLFWVARVLFWIGYHQSYIQRAQGFSMTAISNYGLCIACVFCLLVKGPARFTG
jgi:uncharacterized membrane protein YecN with MAPEG domain